MAHEKGKKDKSDFRIPQGQKRGSVDSVSRIQINLFEIYFYLINLALNYD